MDFENMNSLNMKLNQLSSNLLPMTDYGSPVTLFWKLYGMFMTVFHLLIMIVLICSCAAYVEKETLIRRYDVLVAQYGNNVHDNTDSHSLESGASVNPQIKRHSIYRGWELEEHCDEDFEADTDPACAIAGMMSTILWCFLPLLTLEKKSLYWKEEYKMPSFISNEPHSQRTFIRNLFLMVCGIYIFKKNVDVYMIHLMLLMTAQYRYIGVKIAIIFREETGCNKDLQERGSSEVNWMQEREMIELSRYHNAMIE